MATVTGQKAKKSKMDELEIVNNKRSVLFKELKLACSEFHSYLENDEQGWKAAFMEVEELHRKLEELQEAFMATAPGILSAEDMARETEIKRDAYKGYYQCASLYKERCTKTVSTEYSKGTYKLPRLEVRGFDGSPNNWLPFWYQFKRIHEDPNIPRADKLQYLDQFTTGKAKELVESYPQLEENYDKIFDHLKNRYANDKLLIRYYVREILKIVIDPKIKNEVERLQQSLETKVRALETLGVTKDKYCNPLLPLVEAALPEKLLLDWHRSNSDDNSTTNNSEGELETLLKFLNREVENKNRVREAGFSFDGAKPVLKSINHKNLKTSVKVGGTASALKNTSEPSKVCIFCEKENHKSQKCFEAKKLSLQERKKIVREKGACFRCLGLDHRANKCKESIKCAGCTGRHLDLLCEQTSVKKGDNTFTCLSSTRSKNGYLLTVLVNIVVNRQVRTVRALIDSGCQRSYILDHLAQELRLKPVGQETLTNFLFGGVVSKSKKYDVYSIVVYNLEGDFKLEWEVLGEEALCHFVPTIDEELASKFPEVSFSDCAQSMEIALILGGDVFSKIFKDCTTISREKWDAMKTKLGWVLCGPQKGRSHLTLLTTCLKNTALPSLWDLDVLGIKEQPGAPQTSVLEKETLEHFKRTVTRNPDGRYSVSLPWLADHPVLPDYREVAERRLRSMTARLRKTKFIDSYQSVLDEWTNLGIIEPVPENEMNRSSHYLAHRPVIRMAKQTTKVRPVFDASCSVEGQPALNDCLSKGPNLLELIIPLLIKFRLYKHGLTGDIEKAFLQIELRPEDRDFLRFLWWKKDKIQKEIMVYRHRRLVFGVCCSPFLLGATISHHLSTCRTGDVKEREITKVLNESLYVDDCIVSLESLEEVKTFISVAGKIMSEACLNLRGWKFNGMSEEESESTSETLVLGLSWNLETDALSCAFQADDSFLYEPLTRRRLLSLTSKIFDPLGFLAPVTLVPKLLLQQTWKLKTRWDEELPSDILESFKRWAKHLNHLKNCKIPRWLFNQPVNWKKCSLHVFCDGSKVAYAACVFLRAQEDTRVNVQLVLAKARVAPLKELSIPRMELLGACIGVRLAKAVLRALPTSLPTVFWSDSRVVLSWIRRKEQWNVFVRNRVDEIRANTETTNWRHIPGNLNPADLPSRGCDVSKLLNLKWWNGPEWLLMDPKDWPKEEVDLSDETEVLKEKMKGVCVNVVQSTNLLDSFVYYFSSFNRIVRMCAWMLRFSTKVKILSKLRKAINSNEKKDLKSKLTELTGELSIDEIRSAEHALVKLLQKELIDTKDRRFLGFELFKDEQGVLRLRSRLTQGLDEDYFQNPIVLVEHELVKRLIVEHHVALGHAGTSTTLAQLRERFFIVKGRQIVKTIVKSCVRCKRIMAKHFVVPEAPLPLERTARVSAFQTTGVDLGGPLFIKGGRKVWFTLFTCAVYRAVHLELVENLSTESFIMALRRFLARRGRIKTLFSDQGTNFVGASNLMLRLDEEALKKECNLRRITWRFNPPSAPWWGGWWERLIGLVKVALRKTLGKAYLNYVELETLLCDIESTINHRPLTYLSDDPKELSVLTPAHFIQDLPGSDAKDLDKVDSKFLGKRAQYVQSVRSHLRERFKKEYLTELLNRRGKRERGSPQIKVGEVVLIEDHQKGRVDWPLGKVLEIIPGRDGEGRTVRLKMSSGTLVRPVQRLYPLEVSPDSNEIPVENLVKTRSGRAVRPAQKLNL